VGLALLCSLLWTRTTQDTLPASYRTLSNAPATASGGAEPQVRVVFAPGTSVGDASALLREIGARIVDGPSEAGSYALVVTGNTHRTPAFDAAVSRLRGDDRVVFAEPILTEGAHPQR
jgi:hypothetical protein